MLLTCTVRLCIYWYHEHLV